MAEEKPGEQREGKGGIGTEEPDSSEVAGRGKKLLYTCYNDGAGNYVDLDWDWAQCWRCGQTIWLKKSPP